MATMFVRHKVKEFGPWKKGYDAFDAMRKTMGVTGHGVYQVEGNPNEVTIYHHFGSMDQAKAFAESPKLQEAMAKAGVVGAPDIWFAEEA